MLEAMSDPQLRANVNSFLRQKLAPPPNHPKQKEYRPSKSSVHSAYAAALERYPDLANCYVAIKESTGAEAVDQSKKRVSRADELYRARVMRFVSATLGPSGFYEVDNNDTLELLSTFAGALAKDGRTLFADEDGVVDDLSADDVKLICTLVWRADGNKKRLLPEFRYVHDSKSALQLESALSSRQKQAGMLVVATDRAKKSRIELIVDNEKLDGIAVAAITGDYEEDVNMESVFISYTKADEEWARWIGGVLMSAGYSVTVQYKDFLPGTNFVEQMNQAVKNTDRTVAVLSADYLKSDFAASEWQAAFRDDPLGHKRKLVPVRVAKVSVNGLLRSVVYADIVGLTEESATAVLLGAISADNRPNPTMNEVPFPGASSGSDEYRAFLDNVPARIGKGGAASSAAERLKLATAIASLTTNQVNLLVYALNPPDNEIPPVSAAAKDRAAALLDWSSREQIDPSVLADLVHELQS